MNEIIIHTHIPKTGGDTLDAMLETMLPAGSVLKVMQDPGRAPTYEEAMADVVRLQPPEALENKCRLRAVTGHINYKWGLRAGIDPRRTKYIAVLRNPLHRVASFYLYMQARPGEYRAKRPFREFLELDQVRDLHDGMTHRITGGLREYQEAAENLRTKYTLVGVLDTFPDFARKVARLIGRRRPRYYRRNVGGWNTKEFVERLDRDTFTRLVDLNREDYNLWLDVNEEFRGGPAKDPILPVRLWAFAEHRIKRPLGKLRPAIVR